MKKVSVIVPCYNAAVYLDKCMEHLLKQTIGIDNIEIILVDDASTDDGATLEMIMRYERQFPNTVLAIPLEQNMRQGGARNIGLSYAGGEYLMFCDADDWLALEAMEHLYRRAKEYDADVVQFQMKEVYERADDSHLGVKEGNGSCLLKLDEEEERKRFLVDEKRAIIENCSRKFYRMSMVRENHFQFAEHLIFEEPVFTVPVILCEKRHYFLDEELYFYYQSPNSTMRSDYTDRKMDFLKVWIIVVNDLEERGLLHKYYDEISYLFFKEGYTGSIHLLAVKGYALQLEDVNLMINTVLKLFPDILKNPYLVKEENEFRMFYREVLAEGITEEKIMEINEIHRNLINGEVNKTAEEKASGKAEETVNEMRKIMLTKNDYMQLKATLGMIHKAVGYIPNLQEENYAQIVEGLLRDLSDAVKEINLELLDSSKVSFCDMDYLEGKITDYAHKEELIRQYMLWHENMLEVLERQQRAENSWNEKFVRLMDYIRFVDFDSIVENAKSSLQKQDDVQKRRLCGYYQMYKEMWGALDIDGGEYELISNRVSVLKEHREDFIWLYDRLGDWRSRRVLVSMLYNWITFDMDYIHGMKEANFTDYFDLDLVKCDDKEVVADLGAWVGDSVLNYINTYGSYQKIYCYEIDEINMELAKRNLEGYPDIEFRRKGVGSGSGRMYIQGYLDLSCNKVVETDTGREIEIVSIDEDISEKVTLIKMDIEGAEQEALLGCKRHIQEESPKLLISVYHNNEDIWKIPRMIDEMKPDYRLYLRSNGDQLGPAEIVLFAV